MHKGKLFVRPRDTNGKDLLVLDERAVHRDLRFSNCVGAFDFDTDFGVVGYDHAPVAEGVRADGSDRYGVSPRVDYGSTGGKIVGRGSGWCCHNQTICGVIVNAVSVGKNSQVNQPGRAGADHEVVECCSRPVVLSRTAKKAAFLHSEVAGNDAP